MMQSNRLTTLLPSFIGFGVEKAIACVIESSAQMSRLLANFYTHFEHWKGTRCPPQTTSETERKCVHVLHSPFFSVGADHSAASAAAVALYGSPSIEPGGAGLPSRIT